MKTIFSTLIILLTLNTNIMAQNKKGTELKMTKEMTINVTDNQLWEIVGPGFEDAGKWATNVDHSAGSGVVEFEGATCSNRSCELNAKGFDKIDEKLTKYNAQKMVLAYDVIAGMPKMIQYANNEWQITKVNANQAKITMNAQFRMGGLMGKLMKGMMRKNLDKLLDTTLNDLKVYAETGKVSKSKQARIDKLKKKAA